MKILVYITSILLSIASTAWSQSDQYFVHWQESIGSQGEDVLTDMVKDPDGNYYVVGSIQASGSQTMDVLVSKYSAEGREIWSEIIGESGDDVGIAIELLNNTLFVLCSSNSSTGLLIAPSGREDIVLFQLDLDGNLNGMSRFGGNYSDIPTDITKTENGDLLVSAHSASTEGFLDVNKGQFDLWVFRLNNSGSIIWKRNYGGSDDDFSTKIDELPNGEIILLGQSSSFDGDMMLNYGDLDLSLFKLSASGTIIWEQNYGGLQAEAASDLLIRDDQIILAGNTQSLSYDVSKNAGFSDAWVLEIDASNGGVLWEETHGSEFGDYASALAIDQSNQLYLTGTTNAPVFGNDLSFGSHDSWIARVNSPNSIDHLAIYGGEGFEKVTDFRMENDGSFVILGSSNSTNNLFFANNGKTDGWFMKAELNNLTNQSSENVVSAHPNPSNGVVYLNNLMESDEVIVYSSNGQIIDSFKANSLSQLLDLTTASPGVYLLKIQRLTGSEVIRLVLN